MIFKVMKIAIRANLIPPTHMDLDKDVKGSCEEECDTGNYEISVTL
jgi:hypothetical protein